MRTPPKTNHFTWVRDEPIIPINELGPRPLNCLNPEDDPRKK